MLASGVDSSFIAASCSRGTNSGKQRRLAEVKMIVHIIMHHKKLQTRMTTNVKQVAVWLRLVCIGIVFASGGPRRKGGWVLGNTFYL